MGQVHSDVFQESLLPVAHHPQTQEQCKKPLPFDRCGVPVSSDYASRITNADRFWKQAVYYNDIVVQSTTRTGIAYKELQLENMPGYCIEEERECFQVLYKPASTCAADNSIQHTASDEHVASDEHIASDGDLPEDRLASD